MVTAICGDSCHGQAVTLTLTKRMTGRVYISDLRHWCKKTPGLNNFSRNGVPGYASFKLSLYGVGIKPKEAYNTLLPVYVRVGGWIGPPWRGERGGG